MQLNCQIANQQRESVNDGVEPDIIESRQNLEAVDRLISWLDFLDSYQADASDYV